jgi:hypothetical protein
LELIIEGHEQMIATIQDVISGKSLTEEQKQQAEEVSKEAVVYRHSKSDSLLRLEIEAKQKQYKDAKKKKK